MTSYLSAPAVRMWGDGKAHADGKQTPPRTVTAERGWGVLGALNYLFWIGRWPGLRLCGGVRPYTPGEGVTERTEEVRFVPRNHSAGPRLIFSRGFKDQAVE